MGFNWKLVLVFAIVFLMGGLSGSVITSAFLRRQISAGGPRNFHAWTENLMQKLQRAGALTPEETARIRPRVESAVKQIQAIQIQAMLQGNDAFDAALAEIETELNPEQQKQLERFRERRHANIQEAISRRQ
jgi:hypothetical protein